MRFFTRTLKAFFAVSFFLIAANLKAQDLHFSQYYTHASTLNPSLVGNYDGSYRLAAVYRDQWSSAMTNYKYGFQTIGADVDFCLLEGYLRSDKLAIGVGFFNDRSGQAGLSIMNANLTIAYHKGFGKLGQHRLSLGLQGAFFQKRVEDPLFADQFIGHNMTIRNASAEVGYNKAVINGDFNAGLYWRSNFKDKIKLGVGFAAYHLIEPKQTIITKQIGGTDKTSVLPRKYVGDFNLEAFFGKKKKSSLSPEILIMYQQPFMEVLPGLVYSYYFNTGFRNNNSVSVGLRYRYAGVKSGTSDAVVPMANVEFRNVKLGFAYDVNVSALKKSTTNQGAFEISLVYVGETIKSFKSNKSLPSRRF